MCSHRRFASFLAHTILKKLSSIYSFHIMFANYRSWNQGNTSNSNCSTHLFPLSSHLAKFKGHSLISCPLLKSSYKMNCCDLNSSKLKIIRLDVMITKNMLLYCMFSSLRADRSGSFPLIICRVFTHYKHSVKPC